MTIKKLVELKDNNLLPHLSLFLNNSDCMRLSISSPAFKDLAVENALRTEKVTIDSALLKKIRRYSTANADPRESRSRISAIKELVIKSDSNDPVTNSDLENLAKHGFIHAKSQKIAFERCDRITDFSALKDCNELTTLDFSNCSSTSDDVFRTLPSLPELTSLNLALARNLTNLSPLANCPALTEINIILCDNITNLTALANCAGLKTVNMSHCDGRIDLSSFAGCSRLTNLALQNCRSLTDQDLSRLPVLPSLRRLDLLGCHGITDFRPLVLQPNLGEVTDPNYMPVDLESLSNSQQPGIR